MAAVSQSAEYFSSQVARTRRFYVPHSSVALVAGGCEWCRADYTIDRAEFGYFAMEFVAKGKGTVKLGGRHQEVQSGHVYLFDAKTPQVIRSDEADPLVKYFFNFRLGALEERLSGLGLKPGMVFRVMDAARVEMLLEETLDHALKGSRLGLEAAQAAMEHALVLCAESRTAATRQIDPAERTFLKCRGHLLRNYPALTSVQQAAKECGVTAAHLTRLFQKYDKETPYELLTRLRMTQAAVMLRGGELPAKAVAGELGFKSAAHFSRAFKSFHGRNPSAVWEAAKVAG
jgi:AraC family transcriptional regulator, arabinose operon regulatory protein